MQPTTLAVVPNLDAAAGSSTDHAALSITLVALAVTVGAAALVLRARTAASRWRRRHALPARCVHCGSGRKRDAPPLLAFRDAGRWCTNCIRSTNRPVAEGRSPLTAPEPVAVGDAPQKIWATTCGTDRLEEVPCHAAA
jgi:hypothetical protein